MEEYEAKIAFVTRLQDDLWGYGHINKENLKKCNPNNFENPSDYVMSKFLCNN